MTWFCYLLFSENTRRTYIGARGRASVIASAAVVTNCFFCADFCLIGRRRSVLGLVLVDENFFLTTLIVARSIRITPSSSSSSYFDGYTP